MSENFVCARCGARVNNTPFGKELLLEDARDQFPDIAKQIKVERWKDPISALMSAKPAAPKTDELNKA